MSATTGETGQAPAAVTGQAPAATTSTTVTPSGSTTGTEAAKTYDETYVKKLRDEAAAHRTKLKAFEDAEQARKDAELTATQLAEKKAADAEAKVAAAETRAREALGRAAVVAAAAQAGVDATIAQRLVAVEYDDQGEPTGVDTALAALVKAHPYLVVGNQGGGTGSPANPQRGASGVAPDISTIPRLGERGLFKTVTG